MTIGAFVRNRVADPLRKPLLADIVASLGRAFAGFAIATILGIAFGLVVGYFRIGQLIIEPIIQLWRPIPTLALLPLLIMWFGVGELSKILLIAYACFFLIFVNTVQGVRFADPVLIRAALSLGASQWQIFQRVILPSALPDIITGIRLAAAISLVILVAAELVAAQSGLGARIQESRYLFRVDRMLFGAALFGVLGYAFNAGLSALENRLLRWKSRAEHARF